MAQTESILCVVTPCRDEEEVLPGFYRRLHDVLSALEGLDYRILFVDDGSRDATLDLLNDLSRRDARVRVAALTRNFGHQAALLAGLSLADGEAVVIMDSDLQHPPEVIPEMVREWRKGHDVVSAVRRTSSGVSWFKRFSSGLFYWLINRLSDTPIVPGAADFCLMSRRAHAALVRMPEHHPFLRGMISWIGFPRTFVAYDAAERPAGRTKYTLPRMISMALDAVFSFSVTPIRLMTRLGLVITALGFVYLAYVVLRALIADDLVQGWGSLISVVVILGGLQLTFMGVIGAYLARVFEEVKRRPLYLFKQGADADRGASDRA